MVSPVCAGGFAVALGVGAAILVAAPAASASPEESRGSARSDPADSAAERTTRGPGAEPRTLPSAPSANATSAPTSANATSAPTSANATSAPTSANATSATPKRANTLRARDPGQPGGLRSGRSARVPQVVSAAVADEVAAAQIGVPAGAAEVGAAEVGAASSPTASSSVEAPAADGVTVDLPPVPVTHGLAFEVSPELITDYATAYVDGGGDPSDSPRFFFGDLAVASLEALAEQDLSPEQARAELGNLVVSGYFGGIWLRDNLRDTPAAQTDQIAGADQVPAAAVTGGANIASAITIRLFDVLAGALTAAAASRPPFIVRLANHASVPALLALYGYNRGYLEVVLDNPPPGVPSMKDTLQCEGFLNCDSTLFPLEIADRYDAALDDLAHPTNLRWWEMKAWTALLEGATGAGRFVWEIIASQGFSPTSYEPLVDLSSAYLMISKAAVLSSMLGYANGDTETGRSSLRLQAGLWLWSGSYFAGLASNAPAGTIPTIVVS